MFDNTEVSTAFKPPLMVGTEFGVEMVRLDETFAGGVGNNHVGVGLQFLFDEFVVVELLDTFVTEEWFLHFLFLLQFLY